jgi:hypothetical protein
VSVTIVRYRNPVHAGGAQAPHGPGFGPPRAGHRRSNRNYHAQGSPAWIYPGRGERGRELEVIAVEIEQAEGRDPFPLVIHVIPTSLRKGNRDACAPAAANQ